MSFDLFFYKRKDDAITEDDVAAYLNENIGANSNNSEQWLYENPNTGVYFLIDRNEPNDLDEGFEDFTDLNFSFNLNYFRPTYFGLESFSIVEKLVTNLGLYVFDPQGKEDGPKKIKPGQLHNEWSRQNDWWAKEKFKEFDSKYLPLEKANYIWWFQRHKRQMEEELTEDIFIPNIIILENKQDGQLYTVCVWPEHVSIMLPKVDYLIIKQVYRSFFKEVEKAGMISYNTIIEKVGSAFEDVEYYGNILKVLKPGNAQAITKQYNNLKIISSVADFGSRVGLDGFVNSKPE